MGSLVPKISRNNKLNVNVKKSLIDGLKSSLVVALMSGLAGLTMLLQDVVLASHFAAGEAADAYQFAISFPSLAINIFAGGTLLAVLVPVLTQLNLRQRDYEAVHLIKQVRNLLGFVLIAICGIWVMLYPLVSVYVAKGFSVDTLELSRYLAWIAIPILFFAGMAGVDTAILNSRRKFISISTLPAFMPVTVMLCVFLFEVQLGVFSAVIGLLCGSVIQWVVVRRLSFPLLLQSNFNFTPNPELISKLIRNYVSAVASSALLAGIYLTDILIASSLQAGSAAIYGYAVRPVILVLSFITAVVGNVVLPLFSNLVANEDWETLNRHTLFWFVLLFVMSLPVVIIWYSWDVNVIKLLYQHGAFSQSDTSKVVVVQQIYLLQIPFFLVAVIGWRLMNSLNMNSALTVITAISFIINLATDLILTPRFGLQGVAWGTNLAFVIWAVLIILYIAISYNKHIKIA